MPRRPELDNAAGLEAVARTRGKAGTTDVLAFYDGIRGRADEGRIYDDAARPEASDSAQTP